MIRDHLMVEIKANDIQKIITILPESILEV